MYLQWLDLFLDVHARCKFKVNIWIGDLLEFTLVLKVICWVLYLYQLISLYATIKHSVFATSVFHTSKQNFHVCLFVLFGSCYLWLLVTGQHFNASFTLIHNSFVSEFKTFHGLIKAKIFLFTSKNVWKQRYTLNCKFRDTCSKGLVKKHNCGALNLHNVQNKQLNWRMKVMLLSQKLFVDVYFEGRIPLQKSRYMFLPLLPQESTNKTPKHFSHLSSCFQPLLQKLG